MMADAFTAGIDRKLQFTPNLVEYLWPKDVNVIDELIFILCFNDDFIISKIDAKLGSVQLLRLFCGKGG